MIVEAAPLPGLKIITPEPHCDERGSFARIYCPLELAKLGLEFSLCQINLSTNVRAGTVRGMHFQQAPKAEAKIVQCLAGEIFDVAVDLRRESPTFCRWHGLRLSARNRKMFYIPEGFAHGFQTLTDDADVLYFMGAFFDPQFQAGVRWNDPALGIQWPLDVTAISQRDLDYAPIELVKGQP
jgi:dTDP-4-dehydrorhamnose 3,5-epimerase